MTCLFVFFVLLCVCFFFKSEVVSYDRMFSYLFPLHNLCLPLTTLPAVDITSRGKRLVHNVLCISNRKYLIIACTHTVWGFLNLEVQSAFSSIHPSINHVGMFVCRSLYSFSNYIVRPSRVISAVMFSSCLELKFFFSILFCRIPSIHPAVLFFMI